MKRPNLWCCWYDFALYRTTVGSRCIFLRKTLPVKIYGLLSPDAIWERRTSLDLVRYSKSYRQVMLQKRANRPCQGKRLLEVQGFYVNKFFFYCSKMYDTMKTVIKTSVVKVFYWMHLVRSCSKEIPYLFANLLICCFHETSFLLSFFVFSALDLIFTRIYSGLVTWFIYAITIFDHLLFFILL